MIKPYLFEPYAIKLPFWEKLSLNDREFLCANTYPATYVKGRNVHGGKTECLGAVYIVKGTLRAYMLSEEGREVTLFRLGDGEICMLSASCVIKAVTFDIFVDAEEDTEAFIIKPSALEELTERNVYVDNFVLNVAVSRFSDVMWTMHQILFMSFDKRLAVFLNDEIAKNGSDVIELTHEQIAKYTGSAREVVTRMLRYFVSEGIVEAGRGELRVIDKKKLRALCAEAEKK